MSTIKKDSIMVTVLCTAYNQCQYIQYALDGFVQQKTDFCFEVIVHDDASTDGTTEIIKEYAEKYPDIIIPYYEQQNQYSQGVSIFDLLMPHIRGKYIALCEGDDFWCDPQKLQKQVDSIENNAEIVACVHNAWKIDCISGEKCTYSKRKESGFLSVDEIVQWGEHGYATATLLVRKEYFNPPKELKMKSVGDYPRAVFMVLTGKIFFIAECMAVYRYRANGSWTNTQNEDVERFRDNVEDMIRMLKNADSYSNKKYHEIFQKQIESLFYTLSLQMMRKGLPRKKYSQYWNNISFIKKMKIIALLDMPFFSSVILRIKAWARRMNHYRRPNEQTNKAKDKE